MSRPENPFRYFNSTPEIIRLVVMMYVRFPLSSRNVEDLYIPANRLWNIKKGMLEPARFYMDAIEWNSHRDRAGRVTLVQVQDEVGEDGDVAPK